MYSQIKALREHAGLTQHALARTIHKSRSIVADYERNYATPTHATLWAMAKALGVKVDDLYTDTPSPSPSPSRPAHAGNGVPHAESVTP